MSAPKLLYDTPAADADPADMHRQAEFILSALDAAGHRMAERRRAPRVRYRVFGRIRLFSDGDDTEGKILFTRDVCTRGMGFITPHQLPLGYGGRLEVQGPDGQLVEMDCTLLRCRETVNGWYEGAVYFNRPQWQFSTDEMGNAIPA